MGEMKTMYKLFVGKPEGNRLVGTPSHRYEDDIKMGLKGNEWERMDWSQLAQDRVRLPDIVKLAMNFGVP